MSDFAPLLMLAIPALCLLCLRSKNDGLGFMTSAEMDESDRRLAHRQLRAAAILRARQYINTSEELDAIREHHAAVASERSQRLQLERKAWKVRS